MPAVDEAILGAARRLLAEAGFARLSFEGVAAAAGVGKPTLYRRWSSKADLATAALAHRIDVEKPASARATTERSLVRVLAKLRERLVASNGMALVGTLLAEEKHTPELIALFRERVWRRRATMLRQILERGQARGEIRREADLETAIDVLIGSLYARYVGGGEMPIACPRRTVALVLEGLRERTARAGRSRRLRGGRSLAALRRRSRRR